MWFPIIGFGPVEVAGGEDSFLELQRFRLFKTLTRMSKLLSRISHKLHRTPHELPESHGSKN